MILSNEDLFSFQQAITASVASTNTIDFGAAGTIYGNSAPIAIDRGKGNKAPPLLIQVTQNFNNLTSLQVSIQTDDNTAFSSPTTVATSPVVLLSDLKAGYQFAGIDTIPLNTKEQYMRLFYTVAGTAPTTGAITAGFTMGNQTNTE